MPVVITHNPPSVQATSGKAFGKPGTAILRVSVSPSSQGFVSPPNIVTTRTFGAKAGASAYARLGAAMHSSAARLVPILLDISKLPPVS